jgi:hypothetical protein
MFEYLTGGQCYKCGGQKYADGGMAQPGSPEEQMMMQQQSMGAPQQQQKRSPTVMDAYAEQLMEYIMEQMSKGTSEELLKKMLEQSGIDTSDADGLIEMAKEKLEVENSSSQYQALMQQQMAQQAQQGQMMQAPMGNPEEGNPEEMEQARYGGNMNGKRLKRFVLAGENNTKYNNTQNGPPDENDAWIRKMMENEFTKGGYDKGTGKSIGLSNWGYNTPKGYYYDVKDKKYKEKNTNNLLNGTGNWKDEPKSIEDAIRLYKKEYLPDVINYPLDLRKQLGDYSYNSGRSINDLLLLSSGKITLDQINSTQTFDKEWASNQSEIEKLYSDPDFLNKVIKARHDVAKTTGSYVDPNDNTKKIHYSLNNPNPAYDATWKNRIDLQTPPKSSNTANPSATKKETMSMDVNDAMNDIKGREGTYIQNKPITTSTDTPNKTITSNEANVTSNPTNKVPNWNVPDWSDPYGMSTYTPSSEEESANKIEFKPKSIEEQERTDTGDDVVIPGNERQLSESNIEVLDPKHKESMRVDPEAVRQLNPAYYQEITRKNSYKDLKATPGNKMLYGLSKFSSPEVTMASKAAGDFLGLGGIEALTGLAGFIGNVGLAAKTAIAQPRSTETSYYDKDGALINTEKTQSSGFSRNKPVSRDGGEWNPFVDNRRKLRVNMSLYGGGGPIAGETTPFSIDEWSEKTGNTMLPGNEMQVQNLYNEYVSGFPKPPAPPAGPPAAPPVQGPGPKNPQGNAPLSPDPTSEKQQTYKQVIDQNPNRELALGALTGLQGMASGTGKIVAERAQEQMMKNAQSAGNTMDPVGQPFMVFNPVDNSYGSWNPNAGPGENYKTSRTGATQAWQTTTIGRTGGQMKYKQGGTYTVTAEELMKIISMGGEVEFLD